MSTSKPSKEQRIRYNRTQYQRGIAHGLCRHCYKQAPRDGRVVCDDCRKANTEAANQRRLERRAKGLCNDCPAQALPDHNRCQKHYEAEQNRYERKKDEIQAVRRERYHADLEKSRAYFNAKKRRLYREDLHRYRLKNQEQQRRRYNLKGFHTVEQWLARVEYYDWCCRWCGVKLTDVTLTKDHVIAVSMGGTDWPANLVPACQSCNTRKSNHPLEYFLRVVNQ